MSEARDLGHAAAPGVLWRLIGPLRSLILGTVLCLTPVTSVIVLGWLMRRMRFVAGHDARPGWLLGPRGQGGITRIFGGLARNIQEGLSAALSLCLATLPFTGFWLASWWAGWENSFNKGYEQAFVGPILGFAGIFVFVAVMLYLPLGLAHQAAENRVLAFFEMRRVRALLRRAGWSYVWLSLATLVLALPIFASRGLPTFAEGIFPGLPDMTPEQVETLKSSIALATGAYVFVTLVFLRDWLARIYRSAARPEARVSWRVVRWIRTALLLAIWTALAVLIFVAQFLNHDWHAWLTHPYVVLPWIM